MTAKRISRKVDRTPEELADLRAVRGHYQATKPSLDEVLADSDQDQPLPLGEVVLLRHLARLLKDERLKQQLTLAQVEERTGIDQATLSRLESGKSANPTFDTIYRVSAALGRQVVCHLQEAA